MLNYHQAIQDYIQKFNKLLPLADYLIPLIDDKKNVKIADIGSGPFSIIGRFLEGIDIEIYSSDKQNFADFWTKHKIIPKFPIDYQDMEKLTYPDNYFDIVCCLNALDHTKDALAATKEMIRICKPKGWIYVKCNLDQLDTGGKHFWNVKADGVFVNRTKSFDLKDHGFKIKFVCNGDISRYNYIVATLQKG